MDFNDSLFKDIHGHCFGMDKTVEHMVPAVKSFFFDEGVEEDFCKLYQVFSLPVRKP